MKLILNTLTLICAIIGSTIIALNLGYNVIGYGFFVVSSVTAIYLLINRKGVTGVLITNIYFLLMNILGIFRYL